MADGSDFLAALRLVDAATVERLLDPASLVERLRQVFLDPPACPERMSLPIAATERSPAGTLLVMPIVRPGGLGLVKTVSVHPSLRDRPGGALRSTVMAFDAATGELRGWVDGHAITNRRTAATSVLAALTLASDRAETLALVGAGAVAEALAMAYAALFPLRRIVVWARRRPSAEALCRRLERAGLPCAPAADLGEAVGEADIVSCATLSGAPLLRAGMVRPGAHIDLVGGFDTGMIEAEPQLVASARVVADGPAALKAGDLARPLAEGLLRPEDIIFLADALRVPTPRDPDRITLFKSVGLAIEDLAAAELLFERLDGLSAAENRP